jgi:RimJ/RimL family protein N-acetyltransferase
MNNGNTSRDPLRNPRSADRSSERSAADLPDITIRAVRADDKDRIARAFRALDPETVYQRFFFPKQELSDEELRRLTECDEGHDVVLVATVATGNQEVIVGLGRYVRNEASAQLAFTVEEDYQGRGVASELLRQLADVARRNGVLQFEADVLPDNAPMLKVFQRSGLPTRATRAKGVIHLTLALDAPSGNT